MKKLFVLTCAIAAAAGAWIGSASGDVSQTPVATGCPAGFERVSVVSLEAAGSYRLPRQLDIAGNSNGFVCALAFPDAARLALCGPSCPVPVLYLFVDDSNPANQNAQVGG